MTEPSAEQPSADELMETLSGWFYCSFAEGDTFHGACVVQADGLIAAVKEAHRLKINPGGQVMGDWIPVFMLPAEEYRNKLLTKEQVQTIWPDAKSIKEHEADEG